MTFTRGQRFKVGDKEKMITEVQVDIDPEESTIYFDDGSKIKLWAMIVQCADGKIEVVA